MQDEPTAVKIFKYVPFKSFVHPHFWHKLTELKLDVDRLSDQAKQIYGFYTNFNGRDCLLELDGTAFNRDPELKSSNDFASYGILYNKNTIEDFKNCDKIALLQIEGKKLFADIESGEFLDNPLLLNKFILLSFADLKKHNYYYWFAYPTPSSPILETNSETGQSVKEYFNQSQLENLNQLYLNLTDQKSKTFFIIEKNGNEFTYYPLKDKINIKDKSSNLRNENLNELFFAYSDPSCFENAGWPLRFYLAIIFHFCPSLSSKSINIISIRYVRTASTIDSSSLVYNVQFPAEQITLDNAKWIGWETNNNGKLLPKMAPMADTLDPERLAKNSVNLNLKLMKWRLMPDLNLETIAKTRCLLLGAGTLGCSVARNLLAWGVTTITFVDNGRVSYSNPVRQSLYTYEDSLNGGKDKAETAAQRLKDISPGISATGHSLHIPMPGHTIGESMLTKTLADLEQLKKLIQEHDTIFLLTDSRESRWLPTVLGAFYNKIIINAALGFDTYLIMRHGCKTDVSGPVIDEKQCIDGLKCIRGDQLGCYFCNDITAPGNSMKDRTLDQQCTVTRPGVSNIAGSLAVELLVSLLQHEHQALAPAYIAVKQSTTDERTAIPEGLLGIIPHSIRGILSTFEQILPATQKFSQCIACSEIILEALANKGNDFLLKAFESAKYLEDLTGITELLNTEQDVIEYGSDLSLSD